MGLRSRGAAPRETSAARAPPQTGHRHPAAGCLDAASGDLAAPIAAAAAPCLWQPVQLWQTAVANRLGRNAAAPARFANQPGRNAAEPRCCQEILVRRGPASARSALEL